jgi:hypothetical protein
LHILNFQCSPIDVNTPIRAWREVFKNTLLDKMAVYKQIWTSTCQEVERHYQEGPGVILSVVHLRHTEKKRQTFELVFQQPAIGESIDEEGNERSEVF